MYLNIALLSPPYVNLTYALPYYIPAQCIVKGLRVVIPLGKGALRVGIVLGETLEAELPHNVEIKNIIWLLEKQPLISQEIMELVDDLSARQLEPKARLLANILPQGLRTSSKIRIREFKESGKPKIYTFKDLEKFSTSSLTQLFYDYLNTSQVDIVKLADDKAAIEACRLLKDPPWDIRPNAVKQHEIAEYLYLNGDTPRRFLLNALGQGIHAPLQALINVGTIGIVPLNREDKEKELDEEEIENRKVVELIEKNLLPQAKAAFTFSEEQVQAIEYGIQALESHKAELRLVYGITGSGKTAIYLELAKETLKRGRSVFLLAPEVALALKLKRDVENYLPDTAYYLSHGYQSAVARERIFTDIATQNSPCIIIGTRSALFNPLAESQSIGLIVLDEEHDASYKQDDKAHYHAKEVAWFRANKNKALLLLGSATPDLKTFYSTETNVFPKDILASRVGGGALPEIELIEINNNSTQSLLAPQSLEALKECVEKGEQAIIMLNRRGYAPLMYCLDCKEVQRCPHCSIALTYHKKKEQLICHYCNYSRPFPSPCTNCKSIHFLPMGEGTERIEEQLTTLLGSEHKVLRLDRDATRRHGRMEEILSEFAQEKASVLVGTQMLSKGHHFPHVTLAIIADADLSLNLPDYRAAERTFQLLTQSAGRAGRSVQKGKVLIQTRDTKHYCWQYIVNHDYQAFYEHEIALRKKRLYPPFIKLALIRISFPLDYPNFSELLTQLTKILRQKSKELKVHLLGPAPAPLTVLQNQRRYQCLVKADNWQALRQLFSSLPALDKVKMSLDLDPINML